MEVSTKHQMAITLSEFGLLLEKRDEGLKGLTSKHVLCWISYKVCALHDLVAQHGLRAAGWDLCVDRKDIKVAKVTTSSKMDPRISVKMQLTKELWCFKELQGLLTPKTRRQPRLSKLPLTRHPLNIGI
eukprot:253049-Amphidinium_carterae.1